MLLLFRALGTAVKALPILFCFAYSLITSEKNSDFVVCDLHHGISIRRRIHCLRVQNFLWMRQQTSVQTLMEQAIAFLFIQWIILLNLHTCFGFIIYSWTSGVWVLSAAFILPQRLDSKPVDKLLYWDQSIFIFLIFYFLGKARWTNSACWVTYIIKEK